MTTTEQRTTLRQRLDLIVPWLMAGLLAGFITHSILGPTRTTLDWAIIVGVALATLIIIWLLFRTFIRSVERNAENTRAELDTITRFVESLSIDQARALCMKLIEEERLETTPLSGHEPPLPSRLAGPTRELFEEFYTIINDRGLTLSREDIRDDDDDPAQLIIGAPDDGHGLVRLDPATNTLTLIYEDEPEQRCDSPWHLILIETITTDDIERATSKFLSELIPFVHALTTTQAKYLSQYLIAQQKISATSPLTEFPPLPDEITGSSREFFEMYVSFDGPNFFSLDRTEIHPHPNAPDYFVIGVAGKEPGDVVVLHPESNRVFIYWANGKPGPSGESIWHLILEVCVGPDELIELRQLIDSEP